MEEEDEELEITEDDDRDELFDLDSCCLAGEPLDSCLCSLASLYLML